ncbi:MAG TPA: AraC family transcriptional regulator [Dongiaceae bacterium]
MRIGPSRPGLERIEAAFSGHAYDPHRHDTYAIGYTLQGVQCFDYRGAATSSSAGQVMVLHPDEMHDGRAASEPGFCYRMAYVEPRLIRQALDDRTRALPFVRSAVVTETRLLQTLRLVLDDLETPVADLQLDQFIAELADELCRHDPSLPRRRHQLVDVPAMERARAFLDDIGDTAVTSAVLEKITGLDRFALARQFRHLFGTSPYRYLVMRRLERVKSLIRAGTGLVETAFAAGFSDQSHLTRQFKQAYGLSPGQWRALQLQP